MPPSTRSQFWNILRGNTVGRVATNILPPPVLNRIRDEPINFWPEPLPAIQPPGGLGEDPEIEQLASQVSSNLTLEPVPMEIETPFDMTALGLKEIGNLASWTVSSCKPGCGVEALRDEDTGLFWQYVSSTIC
jgi:hypothetical protein